MKDLTRYKNKEKRAKYLKEYRKRNQTKSREYYANWYAKNGRNRAVDWVEAVQDWYKKHPNAGKAHAIVQKAIKSGKLIKPTKCMKCNKIKTLHAHHTNYDKPLEVMWLCVSCHKLEHDIDK
jgi:hypothetical protein